MQNVAKGGIADGQRKCPPCPIPVTQGGIFVSGYPPPPPTIFLFSFFTPQHQSHGSFYQAYPLQLRPSALRTVLYSLARSLRPSVLFPALPPQTIPLLDTFVTANVPLRCCLLVAQTHSPPAFAYMLSPFSSRPPPPSFHSCRLSSGGTVPPWDPPYPNPNPPALCQAGFSSHSCNCPLRINSPTFIHHPSDQGIHAV